ncbi:MAG: hypothetical protein ACNS61_16260 [Candidatus Wenzhouxiangella sp. M2_3B_020]
MKRNCRIAVLAAAMLLAAGCTDDTGDETEGHALDAQQQALERARGVEEDVADAAQRQRERIEEQEDGG